ncbi:MAG TPA: Rieske 2Fe-2S domain-containing protein [Xanthobacteraceae bacterium]|nr:Rieske 2Fe-2S domain-containing protein [Xanthobacteraceae bacterium]
MTEYIVGKIGDIPEGKAIAVEAGHRAIAVFRVAGKLYAIANKCPHKGASLCEGEIVVKDGVVRCPWHHWNWRLADGTLEADRRQGLRTFEVAVDGDDVVVRT